MNLSSDTTDLIWTSLWSGITISYKDRIQKESCISIFHKACCLFFLPITELYFLFFCFCIKYEAFQYCHFCSLLTVDWFLLFSFYAPLLAPVLYIHLKLEVFAFTFFLFCFDFQISKEQSNCVDLQLLLLYIWKFSHNSPLWLLPL